MADTKISDLTSLTGATVDNSADSIPIVDASTATTKKITVAELFKSGGLATNAVGSGDVLTIAGGIVTKLKSNHYVDTEGSASTDDLDTINGGNTGEILILHSRNGARTVVVKNGTGNIRLSGSDFSLNNVWDTLTLLYDGTTWVELCRANNG